MARIDELYKCIIISLVAEYTLFELLKVYLSILVLVTLLNHRLYISCITPVLSKL